ncbi:MAG TPA: metalloregulator ArsR/SmtB family transcription factor [Candidatus Limnocylindrales bacterium]|nr:metalloregulator ArsR/SmtB family transcription factor [Candidatus Limnocylindrales bacterium]
MDPKLLTALKALSDASRLRIVGLLAEGKRMSVEQLAAALGLTAGTVVHHLKRLREAGLVDSTPRPPYMDYWLKFERLAEIGGSLHRLAREQAGASTETFIRPAWATAEEGRVLHAFLDGDRLLSIPAQHAKRLVVLRYLAETVFERKRKYPEKEVNQLLAVRNPDAASLRRYLVDENFMSRKNSVYRLRPRKDWPERADAVESHDQRSRASVSADTAEAPAS